jgi:Spy/CpxP family protein refolding chaperone
MKNRKTTIALILSLIFNVAFLAALGYRLWEKKDHAESTRRRPSQSSRQYRGEPLKLTEEQKELLRQVRKEFSPRIRSIQSSLNQERQLLVGLLLQDKPDSLQVENRLSRIGKFQLDIEREIMHQMLKEKQILPPELRERYLNMVVSWLGARPPSSREHSGRRNGTKQDSTSMKERSKERKKNNDK